MRYKNIPREVRDYKTARALLQCSNVESVVSIIQTIRTDELLRIKRYIDCGGVL